MKYFVGHLPEGEIATYNNIGTDEVGSTLLHVAAREGTLNIVRSLLSLGTNVNTQTLMKQTPLLLASKAGHTSVVLELLGRGADMEIADRNGFTPLLTASLHGHKHVVQELIQYGADKEARTRFGNTPIFLAAAFGHLNVVKQLVQAGADIYSSWKELTPLAIAHYRGHKTIVNFLSKKGATLPPLQNMQQLVLWTAAHGSEAEINEIMSNEADMMHKFQIHPLQIALEYGNAAAAKSIINMEHVVLDKQRMLLRVGLSGQVELLVDIQRNPTKYHWYFSPLDSLDASLLEFAAQDGDSKMLKTLLKSGTAPYSALIPAIEKGNAEICSLLLEGDSLPIKEGLRVAARIGHTQIFQMLCAHKQFDTGLVLATDAKGNTPLVEAARHGHIHIVELLLQQRVFNKESRALAAAKKNKHHNVVKLLREHGAVDYWFAELEEWLGGPNAALFFILFIAVAIPIAANRVLIEFTDLPTWVLPSIVFLWLVLQFFRREPS